MWVRGLLRPGEQMVSKTSSVHLVAHPAQDGSLEPGNRDGYTGSDVSRGNLTIGTMKMIQGNGAGVAGGCRESASSAVHQIEPRGLRSYFPFWAIPPANFYKSKYLHLRCRNTSSCESGWFKISCFSLLTCGVIYRCAFRSPVCLLASIYSFHIDTTVKNARLPSLIFMKHMFLLTSLVFEFLAKD